MATTWKAAVALAALGAASAAFAQNAATVIANASKSMGVEGLSSVTYYGSGANYNLGQNNNANYPWPRVNVNDYRRTIDFTKPALLSTGQTYAVPVTGGPAALAPFTQNISEHESGLGAAARDLGVAVGLPDGRAAVQRDCAAAHRRRRATHGAQLGFADEVAGRRGVPRRRLRQPRQPRHARRHVAREPRVRRHARLDEVLRLPRQHGPQVSVRDRAEPRRLAHVRRADLGRATRIPRTSRR